MRQSKLVTVSLPKQLIQLSEKIAKRKYMTRSELFRTALRRYIEESQIEQAVRIYKKEKQDGKLLQLRDSLTDLLG